eukprot:Hpha_TRINITY_DN30391_c0_g1::TRINITY_DN30391_c0_g1_i1::g.147107::m.147107
MVGADAAGDENPLRAELPEKVPETTAEVAVSRFRGFSVVVVVLLLSIGIGVWWKAGLRRRRGHAVSLSTPVPPPLPNSSCPPQSSSVRPQYPCPTRITLSVHIVGEKDPVEGGAIPPASGH